VIRILTGDCRDVLKTLPDESVHCVVTSPPYWGLRDYGVPGLGLERTYPEYVSALVDVFGEVRRTLRADGTLWLNLGDCYHSGDRGGYQPSRVKAEDSLQKGNLASDFYGAPNRLPQPGLKDKDLVGIPWRVALALQAEGWWLRSDIIWHKPNPMPESITDRPTKAHEYLFLLAKSGRYYYDAKAIAEPSVTGDLRKPYAPGQVDARGNGHDRGGGKQRKPAGWDTGPGAHGTIHRDGRAQEVEYTETDSTTRNKRSVWPIPTQGYAEAHFATFPPDLIEPCILAGCPEGGTVLDPFGGAGTTGLVADRHHRNAILIELNPEYAEMARKRIIGDAPLFAEVGAAL